MNEDEAVQISDPALAPPPEDESQPGLGDAVPPMVVIPADEFFDLLDEYFNQEDSDAEESEESEENAEPDEEVELIDGDVDIPVVDSDPVTGILEGMVNHLLDMIVDLGKIEKHTETIQETLDHPALTTPFEDYTVTEALLLFLLLAAFLSACARMLRGGFSWLRS